LLFSYSSYIFFILYLFILILQKLFYI